MALKCYRRTKNDGARYTTCSGSKPKPKGKNTSNKIVFFRTLIL